MIKNGKVFGKYNVIDFSIFTVIIVIVLGFICTKFGAHKPLSNITKGAKLIEFTITTRAYDITSEQEILKAGDNTFITIRNVPYTKLIIKEVKKEHLKEMYFNYDRPEVPYLINNVAYPNRYQFIVKIEDKAQITPDGAVVGGNKLKIGLPVDIEGVNYRFSGTVSDIKVIDENAQAEQTQIETEDQPKETQKEE